MKRVSTFSMSKKTEQKIKKLAQKEQRIARALARDAIQQYDAIATFKQAAKIIRRTIKKKGITREELLGKHFEE